MKTFEQWIARFYQRTVIHSELNRTRYVADLRDSWNACDQAWREELAKDRGVLDFDKWSERLPIGSSLAWAHAAWDECEKSWRHKCLNIEQASSMKIAILERQIEEAKKDLHFLTSTDTDDTYTENDQDIIRKCREIRQRHKLDEVSTGNKELDKHLENDE